MFAIVGLGNPGDEYKNTRHNIGWIVLEDIIEKYNLPSSVRSSKYAGQLSEGILHDTEVGILFPTTFMNNSGTSVQQYLTEKKCSETLVVVHDDIDLPYGDVRVSYDRGAGGHNGVKSIIETCGSKKFMRIRIGIAKQGFFGGIKRPQGEKLSDFVLSVLTKNEQKELPLIVEKVDRALENILKEGIVCAMQVCNV